MKKLKLYSISLLCVGIVLLLITAIIPYFVFINYNAQNGSVGIIGGADGPTAIYITRTIFSSWKRALFVLGLSIIISSVFCLTFKKTVANNCSLKTTLTSFGISLTGASGLVYVMLWYSIVVFNAMSEHPIGYPLIIVFGILFFVIFLALIVYYCILRKKYSSIIGIIVDVLTSVLFLPSFFLIIIEIVNLID